MQHHVSFSCEVQGNLQYNFAACHDTDPLHLWAVVQAVCRMPN